MEHHVIGLHKLCSQITLPGVTTRARRTQAERRAATRSAVLESARRLFGRKGFEATHLEEIAAEAGVTIRPIYHYFGSKLELFEAVNASMEHQIVATLQAPDADPLSAWRAYLALCEDPEFRRVVLVEAPSVLGRERWASGEVMRAVTSWLEGDSRTDSAVPDLAARVLIAALTEAALAIGEADDPVRAGREAGDLVARLVEALSPRATHATSSRAPLDSNDETRTTPEEKKS